MVKGLRSLERKLTRAIPKAVKRHVRQALVIFADKVVDQAKAWVPVDSGDLRASIGWTWGRKVPKGSIAIGSVALSEEDDLVITVFAGNEAAYYAKWIEFGTQAHGLARNAAVTRGLRQNEGGHHPGIPAQPFFFPAYRLNKRGGTSRITRAIRKGLKEGAG